MVDTFTTVSIIATATATVHTIVTHINVTTVLTAGISVIHTFLPFNAHISWML